MISFWWFCILFLYEKTTLWWLDTNDYSDIKTIRLREENFPTRLIKLLENFVKIKRIKIKTFSLTLILVI